MSPTHALLSVLAVTLLAGMLALIVRAARRDAAFQGEWQAYVVAYNEGRPIPSRAPRFPAVGAALARNQAIDAAEATEAAASRRTRQRTARKTRVGAA